MNCGNCGPLDARAAPLWNSRQPLARVRIAASQRAVATTTVFGGAALPLAVAGVACNSKVFRSSRSTGPQLSPQDTLRSPRSAAYRLRGNATPTRQLGRRLQKGCRFEIGDRAAASSSALATFINKNHPRQQIFKAPAGSSGLSVNRLAAFVDWRRCVEIFNRSPLSDAHVRHGDQNPGSRMPLIFDKNGDLKRSRGRPSAVDRALADRLRAAATAELARDLDPALDDINSRFVPGTTRYRRGPPKLTGRSAKFVAMVAAGANEEAARVATKLQRRALRRLLTTSPVFRDAIAGARAAAAALGGSLSQCVADDAPSASTAVMTKQIVLRRGEISDDDEAASLSVQVHTINRDNPPEAQ